MNAYQYFEGAMRTASTYPQGEAVGRLIMCAWLGNVDRAMDLIHGCMGVAGEKLELLAVIETWRKEAPTGTASREYAREEILKEVGDINWYIAIACRGMCDESPENDFHGMLNKLWPGTGEEPIEILKKWVFYGRDVAKYKMAGAFQMVMHDTLAKANELMRELGMREMDLEEVHKANIEKLRRRYPNKFDAELAKGHDSK